MGGELMVGIRDRSGKEWLSLRHTNPVPWFMAAPDFYNEQAFLDEIIARAKIGQSWPLSVPCDRVEPSEYGVVLVDFITHQVLSRQDYSSVGSRHVFSEHIDVEWAEQFLKMRSAGWTHEIFVLDDNWQRGPSTDTDKADFWASIEAAKEDRLGGKRRQYEITFCPTGWTVDHTGSRALFVWPEVQKWLASNGWSSPSELSKEDAERRAEYLGE